MLTDKRILELATQFADFSTDTDAALICFGRAIEAELHKSSEPPSGAELQFAHHEGIKARKAGMNFRKHGDICPYIYSRFPGMSETEFEARKRPLMNAWFDGYVDRNSNQWTLAIPAKAES